MEPQQNPDPIRTELLPEANSAFNKNTSTAGLVLLVIVALAILYVFVAQQPMRLAFQPIPEFEEVPEEPSTITHEAIYTSNYENLTFKIPLGWSVTPLASTSIPSVVSDVWFLITEPTTGCVLAGGEFDYESMTQSSFADRVFSGEIQFDGDWYVPMTSAIYGDEEWPEVTEYRMYGEKELRVSYSYNIGTFMLWQKDGLAVPDSCNAAMNRLLETVTPYFEHKQVTAETNGFLWMTDILKFSLNSGETFKLMDLPTGVNGYEKFFVYKNSLYGARNTDIYSEAKRLNSELIIINPFTASVFTIPGTTMENTYISSHYLHKGKIYFIRGDSEFGRCTLGYDQCFGDLYMVDVAGGEPKLLAEKVAGEYIAGYSASDDSLYLEDAWGDAGCSSVIYAKIDLQTNMQFRVGEASGCYDEFDRGSEEVTALIESVEAKFTKLKSSALIGLENGTLVPTEQVYERAYTRFIFAE